MAPTEARDMVFAGAGILWGVVTVFRGFQEWREENRRKGREGDFMKRWFLMMWVSTVALGFCSLSYAQEAKPPQDLQAYLEQLQAKLEHTARRANQPTASGSSVVGLRGSKQEPLSKQLYWKGKTGNAPVSPEEVKLLRTAVEQSRAGQNAEAVTTLKSFQEKYPKSALNADAEETLRLLSAAPSVTP